MPERLVIIGGIAGGMTAAAWARRQSHSLNITVVERGEDISYSECGMPYFFSGQVASLDELILYRPEEFQKQRAIEVLTNHHAEQININNQSVAVRDLRDNNTRKLNYDYLVVATGARATRPQIPGIDLAGVFTLRYMPDARALNSYLKSHIPRRVVIVGGGYIGLEMAEALRAQKLAVTVIDNAPALLRNFTNKLTGQLTSELQSQQVELKLQTELLAIEGDKRVQQVVTSTGKIEADLVIISVGVKPAVELAQAAGIRLGQSGAIAVKESMQTNQPNVYAAGDCCEAHHLVLDRPVYIPLGTTANKQGRVAGINAAGGRAQFKGIVGTAVVKVFGLEAATTGLAADEAKKAGFVPQVIESDSISRAGYYPGAQRIDTSIVYDERTGRLLGAQMVGGEGVAKRIDIIATALMAKMRVEDLIQLDLSYAPPFAPVWDPILYAARKVK